MDYKYPEFDKDGKVICQICGKSFNIIQVTHLRKHEMTLKEYQEQFKDLHITSDKYRTISKFCHSPTFSPTPKPLTEIMEEVIVDAPVESEDITKILEKAIEQTKDPLPQKPKTRSPMQDMKTRISNILKRYYLEIQENYPVQIFAPSGHLLHEFITDFADPSNKVVFNFPKTFWHNRNLDPNSNNKLSEHGWKVIEIYSLAPTDKEIIDIIQPYLR